MGQKKQIAQLSQLLESSQGFSSSLELTDQQDAHWGGRTEWFGLQTMSSLLLSYSPNTRCFIWSRNEIWLENISPFSFAALSELWFIYLFIYPWLKLAINYGLDEACSLMFYIPSVVSSSWTEMVPGFLVVISTPLNSCLHSVTCCNSWQQA